MQSQLEKAINLSKKTGDRIIVVDKYEENDIFVVMSLDEYEKISFQKMNKNSEIRGLTEGELIDKINRDIANWKSDQEDNDNDMVNDIISDDFYADDFGNEDLEMEDDNLYYYDEDDDEVGISDVVNKDYNFPFENFSDMDEEENGLEDYEDDIKTFKDIAEDRYNFDFKDKEKEYPEENKPKKSLWKIPSNVKKIAEEVIEN